ncbi:MAG: HEAT repeat domain-containing protein [Actinobacteria bacterium]|nr:HEAT repeat domain-containing protein [Actinomycetota bacterium]
MTEERDGRAAERERGRGEAAAALLRQVSLGLSTYRLFPGDIAQPAYVAAVLRVRAAAERALEHGPLSVEVHGEGFVGFESATDEALSKLASALFDRRAERLEIRGIPDQHDLAAFYESLTFPPEELLGTGGLPRMLRRRGVATIAVEDVEPEATEEPLRTTVLTAEQREIWERLDDPAGFATDLMIGGLSGSPADQAESVYRRFRAVLASLPPELTGHPDLYSRLHRIVGHLPAGTRRAFAGYVIGRVESDELAQGYLGTMTDAELARVLVDLGDKGPSPVDVARRLSAVGDRADDLAELTLALMMGRDDSGAIVPEFDAAVEGAGSSGRAVVETVSEMLARAVHVTEDSDVAEVRNGFPSSTEERQTLGLRALRDYLTVEDDLERVGAVLESWAEEAQTALVAREGDLVGRLLRTVEEASGSDPDRGALFDRRRRDIVDRRTVAQLVEDTDLDRYDELTALLHPFGVAALDPLLDVLAAEEDAGVRGQLVAVASDLASRDGSEAIGPVVERLSDPRWYVVRNALVILERLGTSEVFPQVATAAQHPNPQVRKECVRALPPVGGERSVPYLVRLALDRDASVRTSALQQLSAIATQRAAEGLAEVARRGVDSAEKRDALERLAKHPADGVDDLLRELAGRRSQPRLPFLLRWRARKLARSRS